ncbi:NAD(P)H-binding protein [Deinococcus sp.]|uniref:NAD(P)-dependent oxidoreductase n=1 Tax=Deinococcus sp. TaxID=47478 RepID=UPI00286E99A5|nr:NAD(P)H-binding protein [Deinococcus sp.]
MKLALLGGTGRTGRLLIDMALVQGHSLKVLARDPQQLKRHASLEAVQGDARAPDAYAELLAGTDAALCALGPVKGDSVKGDASGVMTLAAQHLIQFMPEGGVRRLVTLTGAGVARPGDRPKLPDRIIRTLLRLMQPDVLADSVRHVRLICASDLDWTVVRVPMLIGGPAAALKVGMVGDIRPRVTRASTARFMLDALEDRALIGQTPAISN